jgi:glycosyltransferase involved in cell wall biosynthesis
MRVLWVGTKVPWPPQDGGRLVAWLTLQALRDAGHRVTLVVPSASPPAAGELEAMRAVCDPRVVVAPPIGRVRAWLDTLASPSRPWAAARHARPELRRAVAEALARDAFDVVHAEQPHALDACAPARDLPVVLRAHNVETDLWRAVGRERGWRGLLARREAARVARWEAESVRRAARTVALTADDAEGLRALAGREARIVRVAAPFPGPLEPAGRPLPGEPAVVAAGSSGWLPNARGLEWFLGEVWPGVVRALPQARLHVFGGGGPAAHGPSVTWHPAPDDSRDAFPSGSIRVVPLLYASGVRMRILEAWARGIPVVATPAAAAGLDATDGRELLLASTPGAFVDAIRRVPAERESLAGAGRARLHLHHAPDAIAQALAEVYAAAARRPARA